MVYQWYTNIQLFHFQTPRAVVMCNGMGFFFGHKGEGQIAALLTISAPWWQLLCGKVSNQRSGNMPFGSFWSQIVGQHDIHT